MNVARGTDAPQRRQTQLVVNAALTLSGIPPDVYGYRLEPTEGGTLVTSYYDWSDIAPEWKEAGIFPVISEGALRATLGILARTVT